MLVNNKCKFGRIFFLDEKFSCASGRSCDTMHGMRAQTYSSKKAITQLLGVVVDGLNSKSSLYHINANIRTVVNSYKGLTKNERARLFSTASSVAHKGKASDDWQRFIATRTVYDGFVSASRKVEATSTSRHKRNTLANDISDFKNVNGYEPIFYACSYHSNPARDHADYQGKIYIDRFWRTKVNGNDYYKVLSYVRNHNVKTIQSIVRAPVWLTTRPYCKHYFVPIQTADVLSSSTKKILHSYGAFHYTPDYYTDDDYYKTRSQVYTGLNKHFPCDAFKKMMKT